MRCSEPQSIVELSRFVRLIEGRNPEPRLGKAANSALGY